MWNRTNASPYIRALFACHCIVSLTWSAAQVGQRKAFSKSEHVEVRCPPSSGDEDSNNVPQFVISDARSLRPIKQDICFVPDAPGLISLVGPLDANLRDVLGLKDYSSSGQVGSNTSVPVDSDSLVDVHEYGFCDSDTDTATSGDMCENIKDTNKPEIDIIKYVAENITNLTHSM